MLPRLYFSVLLQCKPVNHQIVNAIPSGFFVAYLKIALRTLAYILTVHVYFDINSKKRIPNFRIVYFSQLRHNNTNKGCLSAELKIAT